MPRTRRRPHRAQCAALPSAPPQTEDVLGETERRYQRLFENAVEGIFQSTPEGRFLDANPALARMLGFETPAALLVAITDIGSQIHLDPRRREERAAALATQDVVLDFESQVRRQDGTVIWISENTRAIRDASGRLLRYEGTVLDVTARRKAEEALRESEERYALAGRAAAEGLWDWNLETGRVYYSPRWKAMLGGSGAEFGECLDDWLQRVHPDDEAALHGELEAHLAGQTAHFEHEFRIRHEDGSWRWMLSRGLAVFHDTGRPLRMAGSQADVTRQKLEAARVSHDAFHDALTGLPNRALFIDRLGRAYSRSRRRRDRSFAVVMLGLDRVKLINDSLGHAVGDELLAAVARRIEASLRAGDSAARIGGDEFAVLIDDLRDPSDAIRVATRIAEALREPLTLAGQEIHTTASLGIAYHTPACAQAEDLLRDADTAMYAAKAAGGGRYQIFDAAMHERAVNRLQLESALQGALQRNEFLAHYQPMVDLASGRLAGFEALIRWQHPQRGLVPPLDFIPIAEETGLIHPLGRWVLREACRQMAAWNRALPPEGPLSISVNLSGRQLAEADLVTSILAILEEAELEPGRLTLEITESAVMGDAEIAGERLSQLRALGIGISIDDFGTGYSSLSYLHRLPLTALKIDKAFVWSMGASRRETRICQGIVTLAQDLGLTVTAEGIETPEQRQQLHALRCEYGQGYLFAKPLPAAAATELVASGKGW